MITELCRELRNWFDRDMPSITGTFQVDKGQIKETGDTSPLSGILQKGQYYRLSGSIFNDGAHKYRIMDWPLVEEDEFSGTVQAMAVPIEVLKLSEEIDAWKESNAKALESPYSAESFGGYSYTFRVNGSASSGSSGPVTWQSQFASRLNAWRKL